MIDKYMLVVFLLFGLNSYGQTVKEIPFTLDEWEFSSNAVYEFKNVEDRPSLELNGRATYKDFSFSKGSIQVDVYANETRSFAGIFFRSENGNADEVYMRMHKSNKPDALQYSPLYNGESNWQLYKEFQSKVELKKMGWNTLNIYVINYTAYVYVNEKLQMVIPKLKSENGKGSIGLWSLFGNVFSRMSVSSEMGKNSKVLYPEKPKKGVITSWEVSEPHKYEANILLNVALFTSKKYITATTESSGLLPISKYVMKPSKGSFEDNKTDYVVAKTMVVSDKDQTKILYFDFSDKIVLFLNGQEVFRGDNSFRSKGNSYQGHLSIKRNNKILHLKKGENSLHAVVLEKANGWGLIGKFSNIKGITFK